LHSLRGDGPPPPPGAILSDKPLTPPVYPVCSLALGRQTGGHPADHGPGDDALQVQIEPRDADGHTVKVPGLAALVQAVEITPEGLKRPLSTWEVAPDQLRCAWRSGLLTNGYSLTLPWKVWPTTEKVRVVAQVRLPDGRAFEADKDVTIRLTPGRPTQPTPLPAAPPTPILPPPMPVDPGKSEGPALTRTDAKKVGSSSVWHAAEPEAPAELLPPVPLTGPAAAPARTPPPP
jgi:hypothetical protein